MTILINDPGGWIPAHVAYGAYLAATKAHLVVVYCASACLALLAQVPVDHVCFRPDAWIGYHTLAQAPSGYESPTTMRWERGRDWIAKGYRQC